MKKIFGILFVLIVVVIIGVIVFLLTFDVNKLKPQIIAGIEEAVDNLVEIDDISLTWNKGVAATVKGLRVFEKNKPEVPPSIEIREAGATLQLLPLLRGSVKLGTVFIVKPRVKAIRTSSGEIQIVGVNPQIPTPKDSEPAPAAEPRKKSSPKQAIPFFIRKVSIEDAEILFTDMLQNPPMQILIRSLDAELKNVSLFDPIDFDVSAAVYGLQKNIKVKGNISGIHKNQPRIEDFELQIDLSRFDVKELSRAIPDLQHLALKDDLQGVLTAFIDDLELTPEGLNRFVADIKLKDGQLATLYLQQPVEDIQLSVSARSGNVEIKKASLILSGGTVGVTGSIRDLGVLPKSEFNFDLSNVILDTLVPYAGDRAPGLGGKVSAKFSGNAAGFTGDDITRTLVGKGQVSIKEGVLKNVNILRDVLNQLSMFPGLSQSLNSQLSDSVKKKVESKDTNFLTIDQTIAVDRGWIYLDNFNIPTETFQFLGNAKINLLGEFASTAMLRVSADVSEGLQNSFEAFSVLANKNGEVEVPVIIQGTAAHVRVLPDVRAISTKLASGQGARLLGSLLGQTSPTQSKAPAETTSGTVTKTGAPSSPSTSQQTSSQSTRPKDLLGGLLGELTGNTNTQGTGQPGQQQSAQSLLGDLLQSALGEKKAG